MIFVSNFWAYQLEVGKPLCTIDGDEAAVVRAKIKAQEDEEDAKAPPPKVRIPLGWWLGCRRPRCNKML